jgi:DNA-binding NtrC family response regulator
MDKAARVVIVDDDEDFLLLLRENARLSGQDKHFSLITFSDPEHALEYFRIHGAEAVVTDVQMPGLDGMALFESIMKMDSQTPVIIITAYASVEKAVSALHMGAYYYFEKPITRPHEFWDKVREAVFKRIFARERYGDKEGVPVLENLIIGQSAARREIIQSIRKVCNLPITTLIVGETGTGKEVVARAIHAVSDRRSQPFVVLHCSEHPDTLLESALFGHERGAFTGAVARRIGLLERADGGILFLDEVSEIPLNTQAKLLRILEDRTFTRLGGSEPITSHFRLIAATSKDLRRQAEESLFRNDLFYRLNVFRINIPPLRQRREDILPLAMYFLAKYNRVLNKEVAGFSFQAMTALHQHPWFGNVRELENAVQSAVAACTGGAIGVKDLNFVVSQEYSEQEFVPTLREAERFAILAALQEAGNHKTRAARLLGIHRNTLASKMKEMGLSLDEGIDDFPSSSEHHND